jgi:hypothetical protein
MCANVVLERYGNLDIIDSVESHSFIAAPSTYASHIKLYGSQKKVLVNHRVEFCMRSAIGSLECGNESPVIPLFDAIIVDSWEKPIQNNKSPCCDNKND